MAPLLKKELQGLNPLTANNFWWVGARTRVLVMEARQFIILEVSLRSSHSLLYWCENRSSVWRHSVKAKRLDPAKFLVTCSYTYSVSSMSLLLFGDQALHINRRLELIFPVVSHSQIFHLEATCSFFHSSSGQNRCKHLYVHYLSERSN